MSPFTDEDWKRLKEIIETQFLVSPPASIKYIWDSVTPLLARLEAAEKVADRLILSWEGEAFELVKAWRRSCGK